MKRDPSQHPLKLLYGLGYTGIVGIDPSITGTGFTRLSGSTSRFKLITKRFSNTDTKTPLTLRIDDLTSRIVKCMEVRDIVFIEDYAYRATGRGVISLGGFGELLRWRIWKRTRRLPVPVPIPNLKQWYTGKGRINKDQVLVEILKTYKKSFETTDEGEAYALCDLGAVTVFGEQNYKLTKIQKKVVKVVRKKMIETEKFSFTG